MATVKDNTEALMAYINKAEQSLLYAERNTFVNKAQVELYNKLCSIHEDLRQPDIQDELQREFLKLLRATTTTGRTTQSIYLAHDIFITQIYTTNLQRRSNSANRRMAESPGLPFNRKETATLSPVHRNVRQNHKKRNHHNRN